MKVRDLMVGQIKYQSSAHLMLNIEFGGEHFFYIVKKHFNHLLNKKINHESNLLRVQV